MGSWPLQKTAGSGPIVNSQLEGTAGGTSARISQGEHVDEYAHSVIGNLGEVARERAVRCVVRLPTRSEA